MLVCCLIVKKYKNLCELEKNSTFASDLVARKGIKRESGESPEQSRCCEFSSLQVNEIATVCRHRYVGRLTCKE